ncbi:hypothetical protein [Sphingomonas arenae]|nr:hypothetical protein [Sphingomonas arenae]
MAPSALPGSYGRRDIVAAAKLSVARRNLSLADIAKMVEEVADRHC